MVLVLPQQRLLKTSRWTRVEKRKVASTVCFSTEVAMLAALSPEVGR